MLLPKPPLAQADEASTVKQELEKCYKRIADLETRVHDLTQQTPVVSWHDNVPLLKDNGHMCCTIELDSCWLFYGKNSLFGNGCF